MRAKEPTIDWLIDELAPNKGKSPLVNFNKKRLKDLITAEIIAELERLLKELGGHTEEELDDLNYALSKGMRVIPKPAKELSAHIENTIKDRINHYKAKETQL